MFAKGNEKGSPLHLVTRFLLPLSPHNTLKSERHEKNVEFDPFAERCCDLDAHKKEIVATVEGEGIARETKTFESTTRSLTELKEWLLALGVTHVAMESTGVYWKPVVNVLEPGGFSIMVVNARHISMYLVTRQTRRTLPGLCRLAERQFHPVP